MVTFGELLHLELTTCNYQNFIGSSTSGALSLWNFVYEEFQFARIIIFESTNQFLQDDEVCMLVFVNPYLFIFIYFLFCQITFGG